jgi:hypothetical protein
VAQEYFAVTEQVEALYGPDKTLSADAAGPRMTKLRREHYRKLGNGYCARPLELDCNFESICETCTTSNPPSSFDPSWHANATTPRPRARPAASTCSTTYSTGSTRAMPHEHLDKDHPHNSRIEDLRLRTSTGKQGVYDSTLRKSL